MFQAVRRLSAEHGVRFARHEALETAKRRFRYLLNLNGVVSSWRLSQLLGAGSVLLLQQSPTNEALFQLLEPGRRELS